MNKTKSWTVWTLIGCLLIAIGVFATQTTITDTGSLFSGNLELSDTDSKIKITATNNDIFADGPSIELRALDPEAKPYIGWYGYYNNGTAFLNGGTGWFGCHYNTSINSDVHQHCSFEAPGSDGVMHTRWGVTYGKETSDMYFKYSNLNYVNFGNDVDIRFKDGEHGSFEYITSTDKFKMRYPSDLDILNFENESFVINFYSGPSSNDVDNNTEVRIHGIAGDGSDYLRLLNNGTDSQVRSNKGDLVLSGKDNTEEVKILESDLRLVGSADIKADDAINLKPEGSGVEYLQVKLYDGDTTVGLSGQGTDKIVISDGLDIRGEVNIDGIDSDGAGKVVCIKADGDLGTCTDQPGAGGTCTCA